MLLAIYLPLVLGVIGVAVSIRAYMRTRSTGFLPAAIAFCIPVAIAVTQWIYVKKFVQVEIEPGAWSAPVIRADVLETAIVALFLTTVILLARRGTQTQNSEPGNGG